MAKDDKFPDRKVNPETTESGLSQKVVAFAPRPKKPLSQNGQLAPDGDDPMPDPGPTAA